MNDNLTLHPPDLKEERQYRYPPKNQVWFKMLVLTTAGMMPCFFIFRESEHVVILIW
jgi:hypothetical protein